MKKTCLYLALCACLLLGGCNNAGSAGAESSAAEEETSPVDTSYAYGSMQKNVPSGNFMPYGEEILFLSMDPADGRTILYTFNPESEEVSTFCKDATCSHSSSSCASGGITGNLEAYGGTVYGGTLGGSVRQLQDGRFEPITEEGVNHFWHSGGDLYVATSDSSLLVYQGGTGQPQVLLEEYAGYWETVFGDRLYYQFDGMTQVDLGSEDKTPVPVTEDATSVTDGSFIYYAPIDTFYLYRCGMDGSDPTLLLEEPVLPASWNFDEEYFYFRLSTGEDLAGEGAQDIYRISKEEPGEKELLASLPEAAYQIYAVPGYDKLFVTTYTGNAQEQAIYLVDKEGGEVSLIELPD